MEEDIRNYSATVMFRGTPAVCNRINSLILVRNIKTGEALN